MNLLGIDFEEWYHPELIKPFVNNEKKELKITKGIDKILDWLNKRDTYATFFVVGELIEKEPSLLDKIISQGHDIAFHTMKHSKLNEKNFKNEFKNELEQFDKLTNGKSKGFRAPTFSLTDDTSWAIDDLIKKKYLYDSSIVPAKTKMYGHPNAQISPYNISSNDITRNDENSNLIEFPLLVTKFLGKKIPAGGGFYLRFLPTKIIKNAIKNYEKQNIPATFYIHSWELTPEFMPKIELPYKDNFITFHNIGKAYDKMENLLEKFQFTSFENFFQNKPNKFSSIL